MDNADIERMYGQTLCLYKGMPVKVELVNRDKSVLVIVLLSGKEMVVPFVAEHFSSPKGRIGYVNTDIVAYYVKRNPVRRWADGLNKNNVSIMGSGFMERTPPGLVKLTHPGFAKAMFNLYPSLEEANKLVQAGAKSVAFDKQFAISKDAVFYKGTAVGANANGTLVFLDNKEYLRGLIGISYEKSC